MEKKIALTEIVSILEYFERGLSDVQAGSNEEQPMLKEIKSVLRRLNLNPKIEGIVTITEVEKAAQEALNQYYSSDDALGEDVVTYYFKYGVKWALNRKSSREVELEEEVERLREALETIQTAPVPFNEQEAFSWIYTARDICLRALTKQQ